jgi:nicotinamidase-related amidase
MPIGNGDLRGSAPGRSGVALLIIDMINDLEFQGGEALLRFAVPMAEKILQLKRKAGMAGISIVYVNDNFGKWRSDFNTLVKHCLNDGVRGQPVAELLKPDHNDFFVLKPRNSGFYSTTLVALKADTRPASEIDFQELV